MIDYFRLLVFRRTRRLDERTIENASFATTGIGDFGDYYRQKILPKVRIFEQRRIAALRVFRKRSFLALPMIVPFVVGAGYYLTHATQPDLVAACFMVLFPGFIIGYWAHKPVGQFHESVKSEIYPLIFSFFGPDFSYSATSPLSISSLRPSEIIPGYDTEYTSDYVRGRYRGVPIELVEAKMTETRGSGKNRRTVTVFQGIFVILDAHKRFKGKTLVCTDYGWMNWATGKGGAFERVRLEDPVFEKQFEVFGTDQVEARYLLTTSFMERLLKLTALFKARGLQCSFYNSRLLLMIPSSKDYFAASGIHTPATFIPEINVVLEEMRAFFDIIETLKLDEKTGV